MKNNSQTDTGNTPKPLDYEGLKEYGLRYIQQIGSKFWTDFNAHDPGVTILEALTFALTDLGYRTSFEMNDLLTRKWKEKKEREDKEGKSVNLNDFLKQGKNE